MKYALNSQKHRNRSWWFFEIKPDGTAEGIMYLIKNKNDTNELETEKHKTHKTGAIFFSEKETKKNRKYIET